MLRLRIAILGSAFVAAGILTACTTSNQVALPPPGSLPGGAGRLYAANVNFAGPSPAQSPDVTVFAGPFSSTTAVAGTITAGLILPVGVALDPTDASGNVFVSDVVGGNIEVYARPNTSGGSPLFALALPTASPAPAIINFDSAGNLYVPDLRTGGKVYQFSHPVGSASTASALALTGLSVPGCAAVDSAGNLYVVDESTNPPTLLAYGPSHSGSSSAATQNGILGSMIPLDCAVDPVTQQIFVANNNGATVVGYTTPLSNGAGPVVQITFSSGTTFPQGMGFDGAGNLYVEAFTSPNASNIFKFNAATLSGTTLTQSSAAFSFSNGGFLSLQLAVGQ